MTTTKTKTKAKAKTTAKAKTKVKAKTPAKAPAKAVKAMDQPSPIAIEHQLNPASKNYPTDWQEQIEEIIGGMRQSNINLGAGRNPDDFEADLLAINETNKQIVVLEAQLNTARDNRNQQRINLWQKGSNTRTAISGLYGPNSLEYQSVGGTRASERKKPQRKPKVS